MVSRIKKIYTLVREYLKEKKAIDNPAIHPLDSYQEDIKNNEIKKEIKKIWAQHKDRIYRDSQIPHSFDCPNMLTCKGCAVYEPPKVTITPVSPNEVPPQEPFELRNDIWETKEERIVTALSDNEKLQEEFFKDFVPSSKPQIEKKKERKKHKKRMTIEFPGLKKPRKKSKPYKKKKANTVHF